MSKTAQQDWRDIKRGARVNFVGVLARSLRAIFIIAVARLFGGEVLGCYLLGWGIVEFSSKLGLFGLDRAVIRFLPSRADPERREGEPLVAAALAIAVGLSLITSLGLFLIAPWAGARLLHQPGVVPALRTLAWAVGPVSVSSILLALTRVERRMEYEVWVRSLVEPGLLLGLAVVFSLMHSGADGLYLAQLVACVGGLLASMLIVSRQGLMGEPSASQVALWGRRLTSFSLPIALYDGLAFGVMSVDLIMLARFVSPIELGIYGAAVQIAILIKKVRQSFEPILVAVLSAHVRRRNPAALRNNLTAVSRSIAALSFAFLLAFALFGKDLLRLFGPAFVPGATALFWIAFAYALHGFWGMTENVLLLERPYWNLWNWAGSAVLAVGLNLMLIPRFGLMGAAASVAIVFAALVAAQVWQTHRLVGWNPLRGDIGLLAGAALVLGLICYPLQKAGPDSILFRAVLTSVMLGTYAVAARGLLQSRNPSPVAELELV